MAPLVPQGAGVGARIDALADLLEGRGDLAGADVRRALHAAPRHLFAPARGWCAPDGPGERHVIDRDADPDGWWAGVYADASIVTQAADGAGDPAAGVDEATSSLSAPGAVVAFLELLGVRAGDRVLEIGTGTGWTAALLTTLGAEVTTVEVDPRLAETAARNLDAAGVGARLVGGDGAAGEPGGAPYDRVHVTCGVTTVPYAWVQQTRPGGRIVLPWMPEFGDGHKVRLTVTGDGRAIGRLHGAADFMVLRAQRTVLPGAPDGEVVESVTRLDPRVVAHAGVAVAADVPDVMGGERDEGGDRWLVLADAAGTSWARCRVGAGEHAVSQAGPRRLWDEVAAACLRWIERGRPGRSRFGMTVGPEGQDVRVRRG
ncbi:methyltransferase domain-containing protein [Spirillospora sp. NBC_01491]|uniref:methyltransferase domain-containing protein n=1 Tax=Spirillospora sp. NBC_01491 TaxID=2976007 RepID=UPI002E369437|nr:methyltransferase domain-containing protein [Spirillospora sp. NBC_01491]